VERVVVTEVILSALSGNASITLADHNSPSYPKKITVSATHHDTISAPISADGIFFPNGVRVVSITNGVATLVFRRAGQ
jgi:hypothetical protein